MKVSILGSGAFGLALATLFHEKTDHAITVWTTLEDEYQEIIKEHTHKKVLGDIFLPDLSITMDLEEAISSKDLIIIAVPSFAVREVLEKIRKLLTDQQSLLFVSKGLERNTNKTMDQIKEEVGICCEYGCLAGPTFAKELLNDIPAGITLATKSKKVASLTKELFLKTQVELEVINDIVGLEYAGALKNSLAIFMGAILEEYPYDSLKAYLLTKMIKVEKEFLPLFGGCETTADTYAGVGDLLLTCTSEKSRNFSYGKGIVSKEIMDENITVEGKIALSSFVQLLEKKEIQSSIFHDIMKFLENRITLDEIIRNLRG